MLNSRVPTLIRHLSLSMFASILISTNAFSQSFDFASSGLQGVSLGNPTSLQFGPDDRLYVSQQNGVIKAFTVQRNGANDYEVTSTETIDLVQNIPNHNDDGTPAPGQKDRQVTGIYVTGTDTNPVLYVGSSDPRIGAGGGGSDLDLDTNSGVISKLTCPGGVSGNSCQGGWVMVHLVRGLPRSEENHATNGLQLDAANNVLLVAQGGHANAGAPSNNFAFTTEYALSAAVLEIDLAAIEARVTKTDAEGQDYKYDLPTLDDPTRAGSPDAGDPFGGNNGLNMAKIVENGPVQIYSPGYRNAYDLVLTEAGKLYVVDNGPNGGWGGYPQFEESNACTNQYLPGEPGSSGPGPDPDDYDIDPAYPGDAELLAGSDGLPDPSVNNKDNLHYVPNKGYYAGHPNPIRANPVGAGLYTRDGSGDSGVFRDGSDTNNPLPADWPAVPSALANPVECDYRQPGEKDGALTTWNRSTNGITEYTASNFEGALRGNLLTAAFKPTGPIDRIVLNEAGDGVTSVSDFASGFGSLPLDVIAQGDDDAFGGTVWAATYGANNITIFEPADYDGGTPGACTGADDDTIDEDSDEYSNADEIDNGTDPCSGASKPEDFDGTVAGGGFKDSNLNDPDDDDDGKLDTSDPFPIDADNGTTTTLPVQRELFNSTGFGFGAIGFTGLMTNGTDDYLVLLDPDDDLILGGTSGLFTNPSVGDGDTFNNNNSQVNALQFGVDVDQNTAPFTVEAQINGLFSGISGNYASQGIYIGTGDQDNYLKVVLNDLEGQDSGFQVLLEEEGEAASGDGNQQVAIGGGLMSATNIVLFLSVDPGAGTVQAKYSADNGPVNDIGNPVSIPMGWLSSSDDQGLAVGFIATSFGNSLEFTATWDYVNVTLDNQPPVVDPIADQTNAEGDNISNAGLAVSATDPDEAPGNLAYSISGQPSGVGIEPTNGQITGAIDAGAASDSPYDVTVTVDDGADSTQISFTWNVTPASGTGGGTLTDAQFQQVALPVSDGAFYTSLTVGPDDKLYAMNINADIHRWSINADGTLANEQVLTTINDVETDGRSAIGLVFDPAANAGNLIAWVTHVDGTTGNGEQFSGKITRLSGANLETAQDFVTGLPRSSGDHLVNSLAFGPDSALYVNIGSMSAMGAFDSTWQREETLLSAATLRVDLGAITSPPLDVQTEAGGSYDPFASGAQVTVFGQGVRNAYDLVWHSNGFLYVPTNGSAPGNTPASDAADICPDGSTYSGPSVPALNGVSEQPDFLFKVEQDGYYGHPNPTLCNYVLNGGNPTAGGDLNEVSEYPVGTAIDADYVAADSVLDFAVFGSANSHSPNGVLEYQSALFDGGLQGSLLVARFHKGDIVAIRPDMSSGDIIETSSAIPGLGGLSNPLDVTEDSRNGNLYVSETQGAFTITLLRPLGAGVPNIDADQDELIYSGEQGTAGEVQDVVLTNNGSADLEVTGASLAGTNASDFTITGDPGMVTLQPGDQATVSVQFTPGSGVVGSLSALLQINSDDPDEPALEIGLFGLSAQGLEGSNEPPLQQVVDTLGHDIDVGGTALSLGTDPAPIGDEVETSLFRKPSGDSPVTIEPVARYSPAFQLPFGWYEPDGTSSPTLNQVGELSGASSPPEHQTLFPEQISGSMSFDPGGKTFGLFTTSDTHTAYTEDELNPDGFEPHSVRVYPLKDRNGNAVPNSFLVAFEEASNGDYQDYVFVIRNALPAQPAGSGCAPISPLDCPQVPVNLPYNLNWDADEGGVGDASDVGTGFTMIDPPSNGDGYLPANLAVNTAGSTLDITTTDGIQFGPTGNNPNSLDNGLGVAFDADVQTSLMETTLAGLPSAPGDFAQAGLWLFLDESHYVKLVALSRDTNGWEIQLNYEQDNLTVTELESGDDVAAGGDDVSLALDIDPVTNQVTGLYSINGGAEQMLGPINVDPSLLAGNLLPEGSGPLSFGGIFATQRNAAQQVFSFDDFALSLTGTAANLPPLVSNPGNQVDLEGDVVSLQISANDPDGDDAALTYAASGLPDGLSINTSTGLISGTIDADASLSSPFAVTVTVSDADDSTDVNFNWLVSVPGDINSGLLLHWPFDETGGLVANDISGNNYDGVVSASGATFVAGQLGNAIQLDGEAGFVADDDAENYLNGLEQITVTTWVKADTTPTDEGIFTTANPDNKDEFLAMRYDAAGFEGGGTAVIKGAVGNGEPSGNFSVLETSSNVQSTEWQHLALVWDLGAPAQIYIDGVLNTPSDVTGTMAAALDAVDRLWVGRASKYDNGEFGWQGLIDDFRIYGRVLAAGEIQQLASGDTGGGNNPPGVTNPGDQTSIEDDVISLQIDATDADAGDTLSYSASNLPDGLSIDPDSGLISGTIASSAVAGSPFTAEITVTDGTDPVTVQFQWTVKEPADPIAAADVSITPNGGLTATTFNGDAFVITNTGDYPITSLSIDLSTALFADIVFDPIGAAGDAGAKCLTPNSGAAATGFVAPADPCVDPFANPHDGGFEILTINFNDFGPGESFGFSIDIDPTSIKNATGTGDAGAVSGLELTGSTVTMNFDDGGAGVNLIGQTFQIAPNSQGGSLAQLREVAPMGPTLSATGVSLTDIDLASPAGVSGPFSHAGASVPNAEAAQTIVVDTGSPGDDVRLLQVEGELLAVNGFELEPFEANEAIVVNSQTATTGADGTVSIPVTLTRSNPAASGYNYFAAVVDGPDGNSVVSNYIILRLENPAGGNQSPVAIDDLLGISAGQQNVMIDLLANDSDVDGVLDASSIVIVDAPTEGTLTPGVLGVYEYDHTGTGNDSFTYTVDDNDGATSDVAEVLILIQPPALPDDDVDGDGEDNISDNDDDNDGFLDTEDPFAIDADNGTGTDLPVRLPLFSDDPGTGLFGLGFTGLMTNGEIGGVQGDDYLDLFDPSRIFIDDDPSGNGTLTILNIPNGDAFEFPNDQQDAFQIGLNVDTNSQPFVVHTRMLAPFFNGLAPQNFQSQGLFIGTGGQENYLKMVIDGNDNDIELLLEVNDARVAAQSGNFGGANDFIAADTVDLYLVVDPTSFDAVADTVLVDARVALDDGAIQTVATLEIPGDWLTPGDGFGLAAGLISTSNGAGPEFDATWDELAAFYLAADDQFDVLEDSGLNVLDVLANDFDEAGLTITAAGATDNGGSAVVNGNSIDYTPAADFAGIETFTYTVENADGIVAEAVVAVDVLPVNDAPSVTVAGDQQALEDAGAQTVADFATDFAPGGGADEAGQEVAGFVVSNDNNALFSTQPAIDVNGDLTYQSAPDANGSATVTVQVMDDGGMANGGDDLSAAQTFVITVVPVNDAPSIELLGDQTVAEDAGAQSVPGFAFDFNPGGGLDEAGQDIAGFVLSNDNNALFAMQPEIATDGTLTYTPAADASGMATVTASVLDDGGVDNGGVDQSVAQTFLITITPQNDPPLITPPADVLIDEDTSTGGLAFTVSDVETAAENLSVTATSSDQTLLPDGNIVLGGAGANRTVALTPAADQNGSAVITLTVTDADIGSAQGQFTLTVNAVNDDPVINAPADVAIDEDTATGALAFTVGDVETDPDSLLVSATSSDQTLLPDGNIVLGGAGANRTVALTPAADQNGSAVVTLTVTDAGTGTAQAQFTLSVNAVNDDPVITAPPDVAIDEDTATGALAFTVGDVETDPDGLLVSATSSDQTLLPDGNIVLGGSGANRTVTLTPAADQNGSAVVTLTVSDDDSGTAQGQFTLTVNAVNDDPVISAPADVAIDEDTATGALAFTVGDVETDAASLLVTASSSDQTLLPDGNIVLGGAGANRTATLTPAADQNGSAVITLTVTDGDTGSVQGQFTLTVNEQADVSITKTAEPDPVLTGGTITYTITVANAGPSTASNVIVTETLPAGVTLQATSGCSEDPAGVPACSLGDIAEGDQAAFTVTVDVDSDTLGELVNSVSVATDTPEAITDNNTASATVTARQAPALEISPSGTDFGSVLITETAAATFTLTNTGDEITTVTLEEPALVAGSNAAFSIAGGDCAAGTELVGGGAACTVEVQFAPDAVAASLAGTLEVESDVGTALVSLSGSSELPDWTDGFGAADPGGFEQNWTFQAFDETLNPITPQTAEVTNDYLQIRDPDAVFALGYVERTFNDARTTALVNADGLGSGSDSGDSSDNQIDQGVIARFDPASLSGYAAYMRMELDEQQLVLIKFDADNVDPAVVDLRETIATSTDPDWNMGRMYVVELDLVDQSDGSVLALARAIDADTGALLARLEFADPAADAFASGFGGVVAIANSTGLNGSFDTTSSISGFASADLTPASIDFGSVPVGFAGQQTVTLANSGNATLAIDGLSIAGPAAGDFALSANSCTSPLPAGQSCSFDVELEASVTGQRPADVAVQTSASTSPDVVPLNAEVFAPQLALDPATADFGSVPVNDSSSAQTFTVANIGNPVTDLTLDSLSITGDFSIVGGSCAAGTTLPGGTSCSVEVAFAPESVGELDGTLGIESDIGSASAALEGEGLQPATLAIDPAEIVFDAVTIGGTATQSFTLTNTGDPASTLEIAGILTTGSSAFDVVGGSCIPDTTELDGQDTCTVDIRFVPDVLGPAAGVLTVESSANGVEAALSGEGTAPAEISLDPADFDFGEVVVDQPEEATFSVTNIGGAASTLALDNIEIVGPRFAVTGGSCSVGTALSSTESCTIVVEFAPLVTGNFSGMLNVSSSAGSAQSELIASGLNLVDLQLTGASEVDPAAGGSVVFNLTVANLNAVGDATGVTISSLVSEGVSLIGASGCDEDPAIPTCTIGELGAGESATVTLNLAIESSVIDDLELVASVSADQGDPIPDNNGLQVVTGVALVADLAAAIEPEIDFVPATMNDIGLVLSFSNAGSSDVDGAAVASDLGSLFSAIEWTCEADDGATCPASSGSGDISALVDLDAGTSIEFSIIATLANPDIDQEGTGLSVIVEPQNFTDPDLDNNEDEFRFRTGVFADGFESSSSP